MNYENMLEHFKNTVGILGVFVIDRLGNVLASLHEDEPAVTSQQAVLFSTCLGAIEALGEEISGGGAKRTLLEFEEKILLLSSIDNQALLILMAEPGSNLGMLLLEFQEVFKVS